MESTAERGLERLELARTEAGLTALDDVARAWLRPVFAASEFAAATLCDDPRLVEAAQGSWLGPPAPPLSRWAHEWPAPDDDSAMRALRRFRRAESTRLVVRDLLGIDDVPATLAGSTALAEACIELALAHLEPALYARHGTPRRPDGSIQRLVVIGMGKLGGGELNFSSDIDLVFAYAESGQCEGGRALEFEDFYARLGQRLAQLLGEVTADGFCHRVDLRLRPFGSVGRLALSFAAMEHYYQREGRDWERYAWIKARPVAGDVDGGRRLLAATRALRLSPLPRFHRDRRPARDEAPDRRRGRAQGPRRPHQARSRWHPRTGVHGAARAADPRRARAQPAHAVVLRRARCSRRAGPRPGRTRRAVARGLRFPAPGREPPADAGATSRPTNCRSNPPRARRWRAASATRTGPPSRPNSHPCARWSPAHSPNCSRAPARAPAPTGGFDWVAAWRGGRRQRGRLRGA